jgi:hypothetical protein
VRGGGSGAWLAWRFAAIRRRRPSGALGEGTAWIHNVCGVGCSIKSLIGAGWTAPPELGGSDRRDPGQGLTLPGSGVAFKASESIWEQLPR